MKHLSHLNTAVRLLNSYDGSQPFSHFLKDYFRSEKKYGSRDRKRISHLCYGCLRLGKSLPQVPLEDKILIGLFLSTSEPDELLQHLRPEWVDKMTLSVREKIDLPEIDIHPNDIFPFDAFLSDGVEVDEFALSHLVQPSVYLRIRPGRDEAVRTKLEKASISYVQVGEYCLEFPGSPKLDEVLLLNKDAVIQDYNSQRVGEFLSVLDASVVIDTWDCCAASGGKSIMAYDWNPRMRLTVSDIRESILANLRKRFLQAGVTNYKSQVLDLEQPLPASFHQSYDLIIADLPCTGSGTWGRTPEQLVYFREEMIASYGRRQQKILENILPAMRPGGYLLFITCSVFRGENEDNIVFLQEAGLQLLRMEMLKGYEKKADTLFAALLRRPS